LANAQGFSSGHGGSRTALGRPGLWRHKTVIWELLRLETSKLSRYEKYVETKGALTPLEVRAFRSRFARESASAGL
jgi:hypothetical protein